MKIDSVAVVVGKETVATLKNPKVEGGMTVFEYKLPRELRGKVSALIVRGDGPADGASSGKIAIARRVLRPRKEVP